MKINQIISNALKSKHDELKEADYKGQIEAISRTQGVIEFDLNGNILNLNENFSKIVGYSPDEIIGKHHRIFVDPTYANSQEYKKFWEKLGSGASDHGQYKRIGSNNKEVWLQANYSPIFNKEGQPFKVVKYAVDITDYVKKSADSKGQLEAIRKSQGVIEFDLQGNILKVNDKFLKYFGYDRDEVIGKHHSMFAEAGVKDTQEYKNFWMDLANGKYKDGQFRRVSKTGNEVWLQASYNPIMDQNAIPFKVVKFACEITHQKNLEELASGQLKAIERSYAVISFTPSGIILDANENFLKCTGYSLNEIVGQHHKMFVNSADQSSIEYSDFWKKLGSGNYDSGNYKRISKSGNEIWLQASYNPIRDIDGNVVKVIKFATDITKEMMINLDNSGQIEAIWNNQEVIEFLPDSTITKVNQNFAKAVGYTEDEVVGKKHEILVDQTYRVSKEYSEFWKKLNEGKAQIGEFKRIDKNGNSLWLQASYNPILDNEGNVVKVVKFASLITNAVRARETLALAVSDIKHVVSKAKEGDLTKRISMQGRSGDIVEVCSGVNSLVHIMDDVITTIKKSTETISTAANEISQGNNDLSARTEQQAASLEETAASMDQLATTVKQNSENANKANQLAISASEVAIKGGKIVDEVASTMKDISDSAHKIEEFTGLIDSIAFQTNILALNAAVEAARAGDQGKGFAVVAGEVRNLAQRSAAAAKEIKNLISISTGNADKGVALAEKAGNSMHDIVDSVQKVTNIISEITVASAEQNSGISQVNSAVTNMDKSTQQNAALVEEAAAAAESLSDQAGELNRSISVFAVSA